LFKRGERLSISSKAFEMLLVLIQNRDNVVTKKDLLVALWPDTAVEESNITQNVYSLRKLLGDDPKQHQYIATVPGRGYRFIAPVTEGPPSESIDGARPVSPDLMSKSAVGLIPILAHPTAFFQLRSLAWLITVAIVATVAVTKVFWPSRPARMGLPELEQRQLTFNSSENAVASGAISPNGKYLAYTDWMGLHVKNIELGTVQNIADSQATGGRSVNWTVGDWLADSDRFVANVLVRGSPPALWLVARVGGLLTKLQDGAFGWSASPDRSTVAFTRNNILRERRVVAGREIWAYSFRTGQTRQLIAAQGRMRYSDLRWTPDGKNIAYIIGGQGPGTLENVIEECDGVGHGCHVILKGMNIRSFTLLRDGRLVVSKAEPEPNGTSCNLWMAAGSENLRRLTDWQGSCLDGLTSSSDGSKLALRKYSPQGTTYIAKLLQNGTQISSPVRFNYNKGQEGPQAWLRDSRTVLLTSNRRGHWEVLKQALEDQVA
jgi:DNA-binding winged helix-turn-helix (wHTH) protein